MEKLSCDVVFTARESENYDFIGKLSVIIDVFRATTSIIAARASGARRIIAVAEVEEARRLKHEMPDALLCGERHGVPLEGFDMGNSPVAFSEADLSDTSIILTTTNGTQAIQSAQSSAALLIGGLSNVRAVAGAAFSSQLPVVFVCAGTEGRFSIEDVYAAGRMVSALIDSDFALTDAAWAAATIAENPVHQVLTPDSCTHYRTLLSIGFEEDAAFALKLETSLIVPQLHDDGWIY